MKYIAVHGIGNEQPGWSTDIKNVLGISDADWHEYTYETVQEGSLINKGMKLGLKVLASNNPSFSLAELPADYVDDVLNYFVNKKGRQEIIEGLQDLIKDINEPVTVLAHSLGSLVAYAACGKETSLFTFGSPLSKSIVKRLLGLKEPAQPLFQSWANFYGTLDLIGGKITGLGVVANVRIPGTHDLVNYIRKAQTYILKS